MTAPSRSAQPVAERRWLLGSGLAFIALSFLLHLPGLMAPLFNSDEASLATMAMVIDHGGELYHQTADRKPPIVPYVYAAVFSVTGDRDIRPVRALAALSLGASAFILGLDALRRTGNRGAAIACGLLFLAGTSALFPSDSQAAGFETFMLLPIVASVYAAGRRMPILAGLCLGIACLCKQTAVLTALPVTYLLYRDGGWAALVRAYGAASLLVVVTAIHFGVGDFLLWTLTGNGGYVTLKGSVFETFLRALGMGTAFLALNAAILWCCSVSWKRGAVSMDLWLWLVGAAAAVFIGFRFFGHYYLQLVPPVALIAAVGLLPIIRMRKLVIAGIAIPACSMWLYGFWPPSARGVIRYGEVAEHVMAVTRSSDRIFVWGEYPEIYWAADREPATRFIHTGFLTGNSPERDPRLAKSSDGIPGAWDLLNADIRLHMPALIVDTSRASIRESQYFPLESTPLWANVVANYRLVETVSGVRLYKLDGS